MTNEESVRWLCRHFVTLGFINKTPGEMAEANGGHGTPQHASCFVMSIRGEWVLVTAGHILEVIVKAREHFSDFLLDDSWRANVNYPNIPFDFDGARRAYVHDEDGGLDYAVLGVRENAKALLQAPPAIEPFDEVAWKDIPDELDHYFLLGVPNQLVKVDVDGVGLHVQRKCILLPVQRVSRAPDGSTTQLPLVYFQIARELVGEDGTRLENIIGMSGCPLIGVKKLSNGTRRYWVVGIQSGYFNRSLVGYACPVKQLGDWLESGMER